MFISKTVSTLITEEMLQEACKHGNVIEKDVRGPKVIELINGDFLKIFRARHYFSGARLYSHARRFHRNSLRLCTLHIPTVTVKSLHHLVSAGHTAVIYQPLTGLTLRELIATDITQLHSSAKKMGAFLAELHDKGVHFHSLHMGNLVLMPDGNFGLIDISDMTIYPWSLMCATRIRSFARLGKYHEDLAALDTAFWHSVMQGYALASLKSHRCSSSILAATDYLQGSLDSSA